MDRATDAAASRQRAASLSITCACAKTSAAITKFEKSMKTHMVLPVVAMLSGCRSGPPPAKAAITKDLRPEIEPAFRQHNRETTDSLRNLSNSYESGIRASQQNHPIVPKSQ
jgi:hypothetical protein